MTLEQEVEALRIELGQARGSEALMMRERDAAMHGPKSWVVDRHIWDQERSVVLAERAEWIAVARQTSAERDALKAQLTEARADARDARDVPMLRIYLKQAREELKAAKAVLALFRAEQAQRKRDARRIGRTVSDPDYVAAWYTIMERRSEVS